MARTRTWLVLAVVMPVLPLAAACGSRTTLFDDENEDAIANDAAADRSEDSSARDGARPHDASVDARTSDASLDATARDATVNDASDLDVIEPEDSATDANIADAPTDAPLAECPIYVDAVNGNDAFGGSIAAPFKTITKACAVAAGSTCIQVLPGIYDDANGEVFPIHVPANVRLLGDEANKGTASGAPTYIHGSAFAYGPTYATLYMQSRSTIAGFEITASQAPDDAGFFPMEILIIDGVSGVTVRNNTLLGSGTQLFYGSIGVYVLGATGNAIVGNVATGNALAIYNGGGASSRIESNIVTQNQFGFEGDALGGDLGGGDGGSIGQNVLSCNFQNMWLTAAGQSAQNNYWDHVPPTTTGDRSTTADIFLAPNPPLVPPDTTGAMLANPNCP